MKDASHNLPDRISHICEMWRTLSDEEKSIWSMGSHTMMAHEEAVNVENTRLTIEHAQRKLQTVREDPIQLDHYLSVIEKATQSIDESPDDMCDGYLEGLVDLLTLVPEKIMANEERFNLLAHTGHIKQVIYALAAVRCHLIQDGTLHELFIQMHADFIRDENLNFLEMISKEAPARCSQEDLQWVCQAIRSV